MTTWRAGRGRLGVLDPLLGSWVATGESQLGWYRCERHFSRVLAGKYVQLRADWELGTKRYQEIALFGAEDGEIHYWSFTSDGKRSSGWRSQDVNGLPDGAVAFEADMPAGRARQAYWPTAVGMGWAVESRNRSGWNRFTEHHYRPLEAVSAES